MILWGREKGFFGSVTTEMCLSVNDCFGDHENSKNGKGAAEENS